jgi:integrase
MTGLQAGHWTGNAGLRARRRGLSRSGCKCGGEGGHQTTVPPRLALSRSILCCLIHSSVPAIKVSHSVSPYPTDCGGKNGGIAGMGKLTDRGARGKLAPGIHSDGEGLYLNVTESGTRSWIFRSTVKGRTTPAGKPYRVEVGLGSLADVGLADARDKVTALRKLCRSGVNPLDEKRRERLTFEQVARQLHAKEEPTWALSHAKRWLASLESFAFPKIGNRPIEEIRRPDVVDVLDPIWRTRHETARKLKIRLAQVIDFATDRGWYADGNPARGKIRSLETFDHEPNHMAALPWQDVPAFMERLAERDGVSAMALRFSILTAARSGEVRGARWCEIDLEKKTWSLPKERMKARRAHRVPLTDEAIDLLEAVRDLDTDLVFPSVQRSPDGSAKQMSDMAFKALFLRMKVDGITQHGFRSGFRDWASEAAHADREIAEAALAHVVGGKTERAYARSDHFDRRRDLMNAWSRFVTGKAGQVIQLVRA